MDNKKIFLEMFNKIKDMDIVINMLLVKNDVRKSFMIQEFGKYKSKKYVDKIIKILQSYYPIMTSLKVFSGILIYKNTTNIPPQFKNNTYTEKEIGELLSYPCAGDNVNKRNYGINFYLQYKKQEYEIFGMMCEKQDNKNLIKFIENTKKFISSLDLNMRLKINIKKIHTIQSIIDIMLKSEPIDNKLKEDIYDILYNYEYVLLVILHNNKVIDLFDKKYRHTLITIMHLCNVKTKFDREIDLISKKEDYDKIYKNIVLKNISFICDILRGVHDVLINQKYIEMSYKTYID